MGHVHRPHERAGESWRHDIDSAGAGHLHRVLRLFAGERTRASGVAGRRGVILAFPADGKALLPYGVICVLADDRLEGDVLLAIEYNVWITERKLGKQSATLGQMKGSVRTI